MFTKLSLAVVLIACLIAVPLVLGAFASDATTSPCCSCCDVCACTDCACDSGCTCGLGGPCTCPDGCCTDCCSK